MEKSKKNQSGVMAPRVKEGYEAKVGTEVHGKEVAKKAAQGVKVTQKMQSSGISSTDTARIAGKALGKIPASTVVASATRSAGVARSPLHVSKVCSAIAMSILFVMVLAAPAKAYNYEDNPDANPANYEERVYDPAVEETEIRSLYTVDFLTDNSPKNKNGYYDYDPNDYYIGWDDVQNQDSRPEEPYSIEDNNGLLSHDQAVQKFIQDGIQELMQQDAVASKKAEEKAEMEKYSTQINQTKSYFPYVPLDTIEALYSIKMKDSNFNGKVYNALTNGNASVAINKMNAKGFVPRFDKTVLNLVPEMADMMSTIPKPFYGRQSVATGFVQSVKNVDAKYDKATGGNLYKNGVRSIIRMNIEGDANYRFYEIIIYSTQPANKYKAPGIYQIPCYLIGTTTPVKPSERQPVYLTVGKFDKKLTEAQYYKVMDLVVDEWSEKFGE